MERRADAELRFVGRVDIDGPVVGDTTTYIHIMQMKLPLEVVRLLASDSENVLHSAVALAEISVAIGQLDPRHPRTEERKHVLATAFDLVSEEQMLVPEAADWISAAMMAGALARARGLDVSARCSLFNDAVLLMSARRIEATVVTANIADFDLLTQLVPDARVAFYRPL